MKCPACGIERPTSGTCPRCGAPAPGAPPGGYSSLRGWRDQSPDPSMSGTPSRPVSRQPSRPYGDDRRQNPNASIAPRRQSNDESNAPGSPYVRRDDPGASYPRRGDPGASYPRRGDPGASYPRRGDLYQEDFAPLPDDLALTVSPGAGQMMLPNNTQLPALPTEEDERAMGIRRPAFIPATEERTGKRPSRWRVISGLFSMVIFVTALCVGSGVFLSRNVWPGLARGLGFTQPKSIVAPVTTVDPAFLKGPLVTPVPNTNTPISSVTSSLGIDGSPSRNQIIPVGPSAIFQVGNPVNIVVNVSNQAKVGDDVSIRWYLNNIDITDSLKSLPKNANCCDQQITSPNGMIIQYSMNSPSVGPGKAEIYYKQQLAYTVLFWIITPSNTPTPTVPPKAVTPTAVPK